jgi:hypothetical protein
MFLILQVVTVFLVAVAMSLDTRLEGLGGEFFALDPIGKGAASEAGGEGWKELRDTWEYSHVWRAALAVIALIALIVATAI